MSPLFRISLRDFINGLIVAVGSSIALWLLDLLKAPGFNFYSFPWSEMFRIATLAFVGYLGKKFFSTEDGKVLGIVR